MRLRQIVLNLLSNAIKFTSTGGVVLTASWEADTLVVTVTDTGIGIAPERLEALFDPFTQADTSTSRQYGGTGLGLTISRQLAWLLGGDLTAVSEPGVGSTFTLRVHAPTTDITALTVPHPTRFLKSQRAPEA